MSRITIFGYAQSQKHKKAKYIKSSYEQKIKKNQIMNFSFNIIFSMSQSTAFHIIKCYVNLVLCCYINSIKTFKVSEWVSEWLLFNANSVIFQLYHGENKLIFNEMIMQSALY